MVLDLEGQVAGKTSLQAGANASDAATRSVAMAVTGCHGGSPWTTVEGLYVEDSSLCSYKPDKCLTDTPLKTICKSSGASTAQLKREATGHQTSLRQTSPYSWSPCQRPSEPLRKKWRLHGVSPSLLPQQGDLHPP